MKTWVLLDRNCNKLNGNLHCHSTESDGQCSQLELVQHYKDNGYSFLVFSEHELYTENTKLDEDDFLILGGIERSINLENECYHINGIHDYTQNEKNMKDHQFIPVPHYKSIADVQQIIDELREGGNLVMVNHPHWSFNRMEGLSQLTNYDLLELFNFGCEVETLCGDSSIYVDQLLMDGKRFFITATDDNHNKNKLIKGEKTNWDSFGGKITVDCDSLTKQNLCQSIKEGRFYATSGPKIFHLEIIDNQVHVECSACNAVYFYSYPAHGYSVDSAILGSSITECSYELKGREDYLRVVCMDEKGHKAWSQPIDLRSYLTELKDIK